MSNISSLITLKSDLLKRKAEAHSNLDLKHKNVDVYSFNKSAINVKKVPKALEKAKEVSVPNREEENYRRSIENLERKSQLYDKLMENNINADNDFLVDFARKDGKRYKYNTESNTQNYSNVTENVDINAEETNEDESNNYTNVLNTEIREHGTGYFRFSSNVNKRKEQLDDLKKFQAEIVKEKVNLNKIHELDKAKLESRLQKIKNKYQVDVNHEDLLPKFHVAEDSEDSSLNNNNNTNSEPATIDDLIFEIRKNSQTKSKREWDRGKSHMTFETVKKNLRNDRNDNFAPPKFY